MVARRWEYEVEVLLVRSPERVSQEAYAQHLNGRGLEGWELCAVVVQRGTLAIHLHWKRPDDWESENG